MFASTHPKLHATLAYLGLVRRRGLLQRDRWATWLDLTGDIAMHIRRPSDGQPAK